MPCFVCCAVPARLPSLLARLCLLQRLPRAGCLSSESQACRGRRWRGHAAAPQRTTTDLPHHVVSSTPPTAAAAACRSCRCSRCTSYTLATTCQTLQRATSPQCGCRARVRGGAGHRTGAAALPHYGRVPPVSLPSACLPLPCASHPRCLCPPCAPVQHRRCLHGSPRPASSGCPPPANS